jgi:hypothetical protein
MDQSCGLQDCLEEVGCWSRWDETPGEREGDREEEVTCRLQLVVWASHHRPVASDDLLPAESTSGSHGNRQGV